MPTPVLSLVRSAVATPKVGSGFPRRIVSLVPSQTELLFALGLGDVVVGVTKFCIHPTEARTRAMVVGGTKTVHYNRIAALAPDLILGNKEENTREMLTTLAMIAPVWMSEIYTLDDALAMIREVGTLTNTALAANDLAARISTRFALLNTFYTANTFAAAPIRAAYLIWRAPYMAAGGGTFIQAMLEAAQVENVFADRPRYPTLCDADLQAAAPDVVLLSSEPFPFRAAHIADLEQLLPFAKVLLVDGEMFSWYGSRLLAAADYLREIRLEMLR